jgi:hypothetical protein
MASSVALRSFEDRSWMQAYANIDWGLLGLEAIGIVFVVALTVGLYRLHPKIMGFGLVRIINSVFGEKPRTHGYDSSFPGPEHETHSESSTPKMEGTNIAFLGTDIKFVGIVICLLLLTGIPRWAGYEEDIFRLGTTDWWDGILRSIIFGFVHMLVGVPVAGALALSLVGMFFTHMYFVGGVELSTQAHFQYNLIIVSLALLGAVLKSFAKE